MALPTLFVAHTPCARPMQRGGRIGRTMCTMRGTEHPLECGTPGQANGEEALSLTRRGAASLMLAASMLAMPQRALAEDAVAYTTYKRSFRTRFETSISSGTKDYSFSYPTDWSSEIVSLNDGKLYGVDLRLRKKGEGQLAVAVLPYVGRDTIEDAGTPEEALQTFVELVGAFWESNGFGRNIAGSLAKTFVVKENGQVYYRYELTSPHNLISANATDGQLYVINASSASEREWQKAEPKIRQIIDSFRVPLD